MPNTPLINITGSLPKEKNNIYNQTFNNFRTTLIYTYTGKIYYINTTINYAIFMINRIEYFSYPIYKHSH